MPAVTTHICNNFSAAAGDGIIWTNAPAGCTLTPEPGSPWPFTAGPPLVFPLPSNPPVTLKEGLTVGTAYCFRASCCPKPICVTIA